ASSQECHKTPRGISRQLIAASLRASESAEFLRRPRRSHRKRRQPPPTIAPLGQRTNSHRAVLGLWDKLNFNGHGASSISNGGLDARIDADHPSRICPVRPA